jgi:hypothetical protein
MIKYVILGASLAGLLVTTTSAEARRHHRGRHAVTRCAPGDLFRPSIGACESRGAHRITMREAAKFERVSKRELRRMSRRERRAYQREMAAAEARAEREAERPNRLLPTKPYLPPVLVTNEAETQAAEAAMMPVEAPQKRVQTASADPEAAMVVSRPKAPASDSMTTLSYKTAAPFSLNPKPRFFSRVDAVAVPFTVPE